MATEDRNVVIDDKHIRAIRRVDDATWAQIRAHDLLVAHQRKDIGGCICGWGVDTGHLGRSHAGHVIDEFARAGLIISDQEQGA